MRRVALILVTVYALVLPARAEDSPEADAKAVPPGIHQVFSGGYWMHGKDDGHYRIVVVQSGFEHISYRLFIQWIVIDQDNHDLKIVRTVPVVEINDLSGVISELKPQFKLNNPPRFNVTIEGRDGKKRRYAITATPDGRYTIR